MRFRPTFEAFRDTPFADLPSHSARDSEWRDGLMPDQYPDKRRPEAARHQSRPAQDEDGTDAHRHRRIAQHPKAA